ncbi:MAG: ATP-dependent 6-phosphofructokinase [Candidatus Omnitrophica bacterium]|nr:ATP-dependent 6-phosphofructokinase [Candidatus Omnitrophota bacterium]MDE2009250.1 ATP-dependent 6-phosphofructokinase [Candidatus Omnitrophota bacterium]MDE2213770.1 ATP-dependent 6-phosphofructokinase [Candidatus Omnitrophota bacterium]MDE2230654.1 ATP-dependent 6-phosphofructokinase [Candidatus Omnitrophota bacterium]
MRRIAILTSGGDCSGLNAVIRAVTKKAVHEYGYEVIGIKDGFEGLVSNRHRILNEDSVSGILTMGGTILGTTNRANPYKYPVETAAKVAYKDLSALVIKNLRKLKVDCLVTIGGDGTLDTSHRLSTRGVAVVGVPKTVDNDVKGTDITFGFDTAVHVATEGIDRLHTTAESHHRIMILEVMGRTAGWIALYAGLAGGGDVILIPEIPYDVGRVVRHIKDRRKRGKNFTIVVIAEGAKPLGGKVTVQRIVKDACAPIRLGGVSFVLGQQLEKLTGIETRNVVLGHLQRGGSPSPFDRILGTQLGSKAVDLIAERHFGFMVGVKEDQLVKVPLSEVARGSRSVPLDHPMIKDARALGTCFGDQE